MEEIIANILQHIAVLNGELGLIQIDVAVLKSQVGEILWLQRAIILLIIAFTGKVLWSAYKNNKNKVK